jgi:hypothetical protein
LPVPLFDFGPEDLARYAAAVEELSSDDPDGLGGLDDTAYDRSIRSISSAERVSVNPDDWTSNSQLLDHSQFLANEDHSPPADPNAGHRMPASREHRRQRSLTSEPPTQHKRRRIVPKPLTSATITRRGLPRAYAFRESSATPHQGLITSEDTASNSDDGEYNAENRQRDMVRLDDGESE